MEELLIRIFDGEEYVLVDTYKSKEIIYHFKNETNEIFCYKVGKDYKKIEDMKLIKKIKEENNLVIDTNIIY